MMLLTEKTSIFFVVFVLALRFTIGHQSQFAIALAAGAGEAATFWACNRSGITGRLTFAGFKCFRAGATTFTTTTALRG